MAFYLSPSVYVNEKDLTTSAPAVATNIAGVVGEFTFGPVFQRVMVSGEAELIDKFGTPTTTNSEHFLNALSFLSYGNKLYVVRAVDSTTALNSTVGINEDGTSATTNGMYIPNEELVETGAVLPTYDTNEFLRFVARYPGEFGNKISVALCDRYGFLGNILNFTGLSGSFQVGETITGGISSATATVKEIGTNLLVLSNITGTFQDAETITGGTSGATATTSGTVLDKQEIKTGVTFVDVFDYIPEAGQYALVVLVNGEIVEKYYTSFVPGTVDVNNKNIYIEDLLLQDSKYVYALINNAKTQQFDRFSAQALGSGNNGTPSAADYMTGYDLFSNPEELDINLIIDSANVDVTVQQYIIDNIVEARKDCFAILNAPKSEILGKDMTTATTNIIDYVNNTLVRSSSYASIYPNYKYMYDRYNRKYVWVSIAGDMAGIFAYTDDVADPWFAPAGYNRGKLKNVGKLAYNPNKANRDLIYKENINPVIMTDEGAIVLGQKTLLKKPSAFDRVNVRRLFIAIEKSIATALKYYMFEQNTPFTWKLIKGTIDPFLRDIQGRQGIYDYRVVVDETNNTPERIDRNELWCDIYIKPTRTAEFIVLNMIAVKTGVKFEEVVG